VIRLPDGKLLAQGHLFALAIVTRAEALLPALPAIALS
jgi:hypothetical protein